jgi:hypothetical protein
VPDRRTRVIRATFESPPDPDRFHPKEWCRFAVVVLFPEEVKRQLGNATAAKSRAREIARQQINDRPYNPPDLDAFEASAEVVLFDLSPLREVHRTVDDGTKVWLSEAERWLPPMEKL